MIRRQLTVGLLLRCSHMLQDTPTLAAAPIADYGAALQRCRYSPWIGTPSRRGELQCVATAPGATARVGRWRAIRGTSVLESSTPAGKASSTLAGVLTPRWKSTTTFASLPPAAEDAALTGPGHCPNRDRADKVSGGIVGGHTRAVEVIRRSVRVAVVEELKPQ